MILMPSYLSASATCMYKKPAGNGITDPRREKGCFCRNEITASLLYVCMYIDLKEAYVEHGFLSTV
jgi:hypothetical protein